MRQENAVDFWRGAALVMIFVNHVPGNVFSHLTLRNVAICDAAEIFVFLAGWSVSFASGKPGTAIAFRQVASRLWTRAVTLYRAHLTITFLALAILAGAVRIFDRPILLDWHNAGLFFSNPMDAFVGAALLTFQLGYFNILPPYIVLLAAAPAMVWLGRQSLTALLVASSALYVGVLITRAGLPSWPLPDAWYLNPLSWQLYLALGFAGGELTRAHPAARRRIAALWWPAAIVVAGCAVVVLNRWFPDPMLVPEPQLLFIFEKTHSTPARVLNLLALAVVAARLFAQLSPHLGAIAPWLCKLGRNSLAVFSVGSLLSLVGQIARFLAGGDFITDALVVVCGLLGMGMTAWFVEWYRPAPPVSRAQSEEKIAPRGTEAVSP